MYVVPSRSLTHDMPALSLDATALARAASAEKAQEERAKWQLFAILTASSSLLPRTLKMHMMGPKISSCAMMALSGTSASTVGG
jgi:hypothetical protein